MADSLDSGSSVQYARAGSSPASRTKESHKALYNSLVAFYFAYLKKPVIKPISDKRCTRLKPMSGRRVHFLVVGAACRIYIITACSFRFNELAKHGAADDADGANELDSRHFFTEQQRGKHHGGKRL